MTEDANRQSATAAAEQDVGIMDCIFGLGVALVNAGLVSRAELASAFEEVSEQHRQRPDCQHPSRQYPANALAKLFRAQTYSDEDRPC